MKQTSPSPLFRGLRGSYWYIHELEKCWLNCENTHPVSDYWTSHHRTSQLKKILPSSPPRQQPLLPWQRQQKVQRSQPRQPHLHLSSKVSSTQFEAIGWWNNLNQDSSQLMSWRCLTMRRRKSQHQKTVSRTQRNYHINFVPMLHLIKEGQQPTYQSQHWWWDPPHFSFPKAWRTKQANTTAPWRWRPYTKSQSYQPVVLLSRTNFRTLHNHQLSKLSAKSTNA